MLHHFTVEFILQEQSMICQALNDFMLVFQSGNYILPSSYYNKESNSLVLVWRYIKNINEQAWDVCHHISHVLFNENHVFIANFCNKYQTSPFVYCSDRCCHILRFGNPHTYTYFGGIALSLSDASILQEHDFDVNKFLSGVESLQIKTIQMIRSLKEQELEKLDFGTIYLIYKKIEGMAITTNLINKVQPHLFFLNNIMLKKQNKH